MNEAIADLIKAIRFRENQVLIVSGNVYDAISLPPYHYDGLEEFLIELTSKKFLQCLTYDLFSGIQVVRGNQDEIKRQMGINGNGSNGKNADLIQALKKAVAAKNKFPVNPLEAFACLDQLFRSESAKPTAVLIDAAEALLPSQNQNFPNPNQRALSIAVTKWSRNNAIRDKGHLIILICRRAIDLEERVLDRSFRILQLRIPKPTEKERAEFLSEHRAPAAKVPILSKITSGLSLNELMKVVDYCLNSENLEEALKQVFSLKQKILADEYGDILEIMHPQNGFEAIGGLEKSITELKRIAEAMRTGRTTLVPQGVMFIGPPGTGKTVLAEAFAKEAGLNFVKPLDIKTMWVGSSEKRMTRLLEALKDLAPVAAFIDEFDQNQGQRGSFDGDSGVSRNLFKKMLEVTADTSLRGKILWIFATNRPDLIDSAMKRSGRCDLRIPFFPPDRQQLAAICRTAFKQYPDMRSEIENWAPYAERCNGYTGADIIEVVRRAWKYANDEGRQSVTNSDMEWACEDYRPESTDKKMVAKMTIFALISCSSKSLMPDNWKEVAAAAIEELSGRRPEPENVEKELKNFTKLLKDENQTP